MEKHMPKFLEPYVYSLTIHNRTRFALVPAKARVNQGVWFRGRVDGAGPVAVQPGEMIEALGIRASMERNRGYECRCAWNSDDENEPASLALFISVPFAGGRNKSGLDVSGCIKVSGWTGVSVIGHRFEHKLEVSLIPAFCS